MCSLRKKNPLPRDFRKEAGEKIKRGVSFKAPYNEIKCIEKGLLTTHVKRRLGTKLPQVCLFHIVKGFKLDSVLFRIHLGRSKLQVL